LSILVRAERSGAAPVAGLGLRARHGGGAMIVSGRSQTVRCVVIDA
jgi:hypothetical protein